MKHSFSSLLIIVMTLFAPPLNAQIQLGLQAGTNLGDVTYEPKQQGFETGIRTGFMFGGVVFYSFSPIIGLQAEPAYVQKGSKVDASVTEQGMTIKEELSLTAGYFDFPVLLKASFGDGPVKPYLLAGASLAFLLGDAKIKIDKATLNGVDVTNQIPGDQREQTLQTKSTDLTLNFGGGVIIPVSKVNIFIEGQYNLGLKDVSNETPDPGGQDLTIKTKGIQIKAGVLFPLN